jgi:hypothetical protein
MRADFVNEVSRILDIKRKDMIEKDLILHQILFDLSGDRFFAESVLFKGGTCLIKSYFGYLRFSEDIDFTWKGRDEPKFPGVQTSYSPYALVKATTCSVYGCREIRNGDECNASDEKD